MSVIRNLLVRIGADLTGLRNAQREIRNTARNIGAALAGIGVGMSFASAIDEAMKFEANMQQVNRMMGESAKEFQKWADESAIAFGISQAEAIKYGAVFSNLIGTFTSDTNQAMNHTRDILKASAVISAATGRDMEDVMFRIRSGLLGNTEAIEDLGVNVNVAMLESTDAFKKFANGKSWAQLSFQTQQQIRLFGIMEQTAKKYGLELADNTASRVGTFTAHLKNARLALGQAFLPIVNAILPYLTRFAAALATTMQYIAAFTAALFGYKQAQQTAAVTDQANAVGGLGDAYDEAGKKAKKAQKSVAGFDQVNLVGGTSGAGDDSGGAGGTVDAGLGGTGGLLADVGEAMNEAAEKAQAMVAKIKKAFTDMKNAIVQNKEIIIAALAGIAAGFVTYLLVSGWSAGVGALAANFKKLGVAIRAAWLALTGPIGLIVLAVSALVAAVVYFYQTNETFRGVVDGIFKEIGDTAKWLWNDVLVPLGAWLADVFVAAWGAVKVAAEWLWKNVLVPLGNYLLWFWNNVISPVARVLKEALGIAFKTVADIAKSFWKNVLIPLGEFFTETFGPAVEALSAVFKFLWDKVLKPFATFLGGVLKVEFKALTDTIVRLWDNVLKPLMTFLSGVFKSTFEAVFKTLGGVIDGLKTAFIGFMNFITGVFTGDWKTAWNGIEQVFKGITDSIGSYFKGMVNIVIDSLNWLIRQMNKITFDMPDWVPGWAGGGESFGISIKEVPRLAKGGLAFGPTLAMVGDNKGAASDPEVIAPLSKLEAMIGKDDNREVVSVLNAILGAIKASGSGDSVSMSKTELGRAASAGLNDLTRRSGRTAFNV